MDQSDIYPVNNLDSNIVSENNLPSVIDGKENQKIIKESGRIKKTKNKENEISSNLNGNNNINNSKLKFSNTKTRSSSSIDLLNRKSKEKKPKKSNGTLVQSPSKDEIFEHKTVRLKTKKRTSSIGLEFSTLRLPKSTEIEFIHRSPRSRLIKEVTNPIIKNRLCKLDRSSSMRVHKEIDSRILPKEDDDWKMLKMKKNSLNSIEFPINRSGSGMIKLNRSLSEPFLNSWEYGNLDADFAIPQHESVLDYLQTKFDKKTNYRRSRKKKRTTSPDNEMMLNILKEVNDKITEISHDGDDVVYEKISEKEIKIMAGTKEKLFTLLADHRVQDKEYIDIFLATHLRFMSTKELLNSLISYFVNPINKQAVQHLSEQEKSQYIMLIRMRIVNVFKKWLKYHYAYEFEKIEIASKIESWIYSLKKDKELSTLSKFLKETWKSRLKTNFESYEFDDEDSPPKSILPKKQNAEDLSFLDIDPIELARQITLLNQKMFKFVRNNHLLEVLDNKDDESNPVVGISKYSKTMTAWVTTEIITTPQMKKRVLVLSNFVRLCYSLVHMNNFHAAMDIYLGISHFLVNKLKKTKKGLTSSTKEKWKYLDELFKPDGGWKNLRKSIKESTAPLIIPPAIWLHDLITINENDDYWESDKGHKLLNFHKLRLFCSVFQEVYKCQLEPYNFEVVPTIETYLMKHLVALSTEDLENEAKIIEASNASKQKDLSKSKKEKLLRKPSFTMLLKFKSPKKEKEK